MDWDLSKLTDYADNIEIYQSIDAIIAKLKVEASAGGHFVLMSNGSFGGIYQRLQDELQAGSGDDGNQCYFASRLKER